MSIPALKPPLRLTPNPTPPPRIFSPLSLSTTSPFQTLKTFYFIKPSSSLSSSVQFCLHHQQFNNRGGGEEEEEEVVIGDCLVFEEGVFEDPYIHHNFSSKNLVDHQNSARRKPTLVKKEIQPENLIPEKWKEAQVEINITKKERRKLAQEMEFGKRLQKKKQGLRPIVSDLLTSETLSHFNLNWKPLVLDNPDEFPVGKKNNVFGGESKASNYEDGFKSSRVSPRNPRLAVYGATLDDVSEVLNSPDYDPDVAKKPEGSHTLFTKEEKVLLNGRVPDLAAATSGKWQPLHTLAASGEFYLVNALLKYNVDINILDKDGLTALHKAVLGKKQAIFNYLLRESANPFVRDRDGATLMHYAVCTASTQMIKILLLYNVDINLQDNDGWTPLHLAVQSRRTDVVRLLLIKGADKTLKNHGGLTPLDLCLYGGRDARTYELIRLMKQLPRPHKEADT